MSFSSEYFGCCWLEQCRHFPFIGGMSFPMNTLPRGCLILCDLHAALAFGIYAPICAKNMLFYFIRFAYYSRTFSRALKSLVAPSGSWGPECNWKVSRNLPVEVMTWITLGAPAPRRGNKPSPVPPSVCFFWRTCSMLLSLPQPDPDLLLPLRGAGAPSVIQVITSTGKFRETFQLSFV